MLKPTSVTIRDSHLLAEMRLFTTFSLLSLTWLALGNAIEPYIFCCYRRSAVTKLGYERMKISDIDPSLCTHLIYMDVGITENGDVKLVLPETNLPNQWSRDSFRKFNRLRKKNKKLKTLVSSSGAVGESATYSKVAADSLLRSKYVKNVVDFVLRHEFDGFNIDWEWPTRNGGSPDDEQNYPLLLKKLRKSFDKHKLILSIAVLGLKRYARDAYDIPQMTKYPHFILLHTVYHHPEESIIGHSSPLFPAASEISPLDRSVNYEAVVSYWLEQGVPAKKVIMGTRFYGIGYILKNSAEHVPGSQAIGPARYGLGSGFIGYNEICRLTPQDAWTTVWDVEQRVPYSYAGDRWISYDNVRSLTEKGEYAKAMGLGGVGVFTIDMDDHQGDCGDRYPLLNALNCGLREIGCSAEPTPEASTPAKDADRTMFSSVSPSLSSDFATTPKSDMTYDPDEYAKRICAMFDLKYVRHPQNCAKFWICQKIHEDEFNAEPFICGFGLYFDTRKIICESKNVVRCSSREVDIWSWE